MENIISNENEVVYKGEEGLSWFDIPCIFDDYGDDAISSFKDYGDEKLLDFKELEGASIPSSFYQEEE